MVRARKVWVVFTAGLAIASTVVVATQLPAAAASAGDEAALRAAFADNAETLVDLTADITLTTCDTGNVQRNSDTDLTLDGHGHTITQTCANRVLEIKGGGQFTAKNLTITGGDATGNTTPIGGGIGHFGPGRLEVIDSVITGNNAEGGGAIMGDGGMTVTDSQIIGNTALYNSALDSELDITVVGSTIENNTSAGDEEIQAGGTIGASGSVTIRNSTIANNIVPTRSAIGSGGPVTIVNSTMVGNAPGDGIFADGHLSLVYATIVDNGGPEGGNIVAFGGLTSFASVVALARNGSDNCGVQGDSVSNGFNFSDDDTCGFTNAAQGDKQSAGDPALDALGDNGGKTQIRKPSDTSPLKDAIAAASCKADGAAEITADQVGTVRPQGSGCDIGAVEVAQAAATTTTTSASSASAPPAVSSSSNAKSSSSGAPIALIVLAVLVIGGIVIALLLRRRRSDEAA